jgi:WD40 repeat protein
MEETVKIRYRDFLQRKASSLKPAARKVFLVESDPDNRGKGDKDRAKDLGMTETAYTRQKTSMYQQLGFRAEGHKREDFLRQLEKEFSESPSEQEHKRAETAEKIAEIEVLLSRSQEMLFSHDQLKALLASVKAGITLQEIEAPFGLQRRVVERLRQVLCQVQECNRLHSLGCWGVSFSPDGQTIASGNLDGTVTIWSRDTKKPLTLQGHQSRVWGVTFSPDGQMIASASKEGTVKLWNLNDKVPRTFEAHNDDVNSVSFSPDSQMIASASRDGTVKLWNLNGTVRQIFQGQGHNASVDGVSFSPDGQIIASASTDGTVKLWNVDGTVRQTLQEGHPEHLSWHNSVSFSPDGQMIASGSGKHSVKLWSRDGREVGTLQGHSDSVWDVSFSPDGQMLASASRDGTVKLWNLNEPGQLWNHDGRHMQTCRGHNHWVTGVSFSSDSQMLASAASDGTVRLWSLDGTAKLYSFCGSKLDRGKRDWLASTIFSPEIQMFFPADQIRISMLDSLELDDLVVCGCNWLHDYLKTNPYLSESDRHLCDGIGTQK